MDRLVVLRRGGLRKSRRRRPAEGVESSLTIQRRSESADRECSCAFGEDSGASSGARPCDCQRQDGYLGHGSECEPDGTSKRQSKPLFLALLDKAEVLAPAALRPRSHQVHERGSRRALCGSRRKSRVQGLLGSGDESGWRLVDVRVGGTLERGHQYAQVALPRAR